MSASRITHTFEQARQNVSHINWFLAAALLTAGVVAWPILSQPGLLNTRGGGDSPFLLQRLQQLSLALADGHFPVRWMPDANYGYGYPFFNYYAPLSIYIATIFRYIGFGFVRAIQLAQLLGFLLAAWSMFHLGRRWLGSDWTGLLAAAAYTVAPFHLVNVYVRGDALAEFWAMALFPLIFLALDNLLQASFLDPGSVARSGAMIMRSPVALFALAFAALILSHNISALIFTPFLLLYLIINAWYSLKGNLPDVSFSRSPAKNLTWPIVAIVLALALSAWFWLPALAEQSLAQLGPVTSGYFHFGNHFRGVELVQSSILFDYDVAGGRAFRMGLIQAVAILLGLIALVTRGKRVEGASTERMPYGGFGPTPRLFILSGFIIATLMITPLSRPLWESLPLLPFTQFPWRFLSVQAFFGALLIGSLGLLPGRRFLVPTTIVILLFASLGNLHTDYLSLNDSDATAERLAQYEWFTGNIGTTVSAEYLPQTVQPRPYTSPWLNAGERDTVQQLNRQLTSAEQVDRRASRQSWRIVANAPVNALTFPVLYWPGWEATVDGDPAEIRPAPGSGLIALELPAGEHTVVLRLARTPIRLAAEIFSLAATIVTLWLLKPAAYKKPRRGTLIALMFLVMLVVLVRLRPQGTGSRDDLNWDFAQLAYLHHNEAGVSFDNGARLQSYSYSHDEVEAGEEITVTLNWNAGSEGAATVSLASPAVNRFGEAPLLVSETQPVAAQQTVFHFTVPENGPAGLYVPRLIVGDARPLTSSGQTRGDLFLRPIRVIDRAQQAIGNDGSMDARAANVTQRDPNTLDVQLQWLTQQALTNDFNFSLRLVNANGTEIVRLDGQPGYGFQPSSGWTVGHWIDDWLSLRLPSELLAAHSGSMPFALVARLYDVETGSTTLTRRLGELVWRGEELVFRDTLPVLELPNGLEPVTAIFGEAIELRGYTLSKTEESLKMTLYWQALAAGQEDLYHFVHLADRTSGEILAQHDGMPRRDSYPTSQWSAGEIVSDPLTLDISEVPVGEYELHVGLYRRMDGGSARIPAVDAQGRPLPEDRLPIPESIIVSDN